MHTHLDYLVKFRDMLLSVIPGTVTFDEGKRKGGKTPGELRDGVWHPSKWRDMGEIAPRRAKKWNADGSAIGLRTGIRGHHGLDVDITDAGLAETVKAFLRTIMPEPMFRGVDHPDHHKFLCFLRLIDFASGEPINKRKLVIHFTQPDGQPGKIELLGDGQYFNTDGIHPDRSATYVWNRHPVDHPVPEICEEDFQDLLRGLQDALTLGGAKLVRIGSASIGATTPSISQQSASEQQLRALLAMIPNGERFADRRAWMAIFHAIWVASDGAPYGREAWLDWCFSIEQDDPNEPERVWDAGAINPTSPGLSALLNWASESAKPEVFNAFQQEAAKAVFDVVEPQDEPAFVDDIITRIVREWVYVSSENTFYKMPNGVVHSPAGFVGALRSVELTLRLAWGARAGKTKPVKGALPALFQQFHPDRVADRVVKIPGRPVLFQHDDLWCLNLWRPVPRPLANQRIDPALIERYLEHCTYILGSVEAARLWLKWHAFLLQHPSEQPGWHWLVMSEQGLGKDLMLKPFVRTYEQNESYYLLAASVLRSSFNEYAACRLVEVSELKQMSGSHDTYSELKSVMSQSGSIALNRKYVASLMVQNVMACVMFSNERLPIYIDEKDRRIYAIDCFDTPPRSAEYYAALAEFGEAHAAEIAEHCFQMRLTAVDLTLLRGRAPATQTKQDIANATMDAMDHALREIYTSIEDGSDGFRPVFTTKELVSWLRDEGMRVMSTPRYLTLYAAGFRPVYPSKINLKQAAGYKGKKMWRVRRYTMDNGNTIDLDNMRPISLYKLYKTGKFGPVAVSDDEDETDESDEI